MGDKIGTVAMNESLAFGTCVPKEISASSPSKLLSGCLLCFGL